MLNNISRLLKVFAIMGIIVVAILYILLIADVITKGQMEENSWKAIKIIGVLVVVSVLTIFITEIKNK